MRLSELLSPLAGSITIEGRPGLPGLPPECPDPDIRTVTEHSSSADRESLFVCIRGFCSDGHAYAPDAYRRGCRIFVAGHALSLPPDALVILVPDTHHVLGILACRFYRNPSHRIRVIGITGTKGKTTAASMLHHILTQSGRRCGYIGTNGILYGSVQRETCNTTPDALTFQQTLAEMADAGCEAVIAEVSSQALKLGRVSGSRFDACIYTNLSRDHIGPGEHPDLFDYIACKHRLFTDYGARTVIYNADDPYAGEMLRGTSADTVVSCGSHVPADYIAADVRSVRSSTRLGVDFILQAAGRCVACSLPLIGSVNASNATLALACAERCFGIDPMQAADFLQHVRISGRSEVIRLPNGAVAVIDYAHNGVSLRQLLTGLRVYAPARLICLFGSVGGRTALRRRELGQVAASLADLCILTSDNPGTEPPDRIIGEIAAAFREFSTPYFSIPDRADAIRTAVRLTGPEDILVLAGKGHETYQLIGTEKIPFCERELLTQAKQCDGSIAGRVL